MKGEVGRLLTKLERGWKIGDYKTTQTKEGKLFL